METWGTIPEWVAAVALLGQAGVFVWQTRIFKHHADSQKLIGEVLQQQAGIMERQVKITEDAGRFTRRMAVKEEREKLFDFILSMKARVIAVIEATRVYEVDHNLFPLDASWQRMADYSSVCQKALITCIHIPTDVRNYFLEYAIKAATVADARPRPGTAQQLSANAKQLADLNAKYEDYTKTMIEVAQTPVDV